MNHHLDHHNPAKMHALLDEALLDEAFYTQHGIYSFKSGIQETKEFREMLKLSNGDSMRRETVTRNCNYRMRLSQFSLLGCFQPVPFSCCETSME
jgi:hypothetical protein